MTEPFIEGDDERQLAALCSIVEKAESIVVVVRGVRVGIDPRLMERLCQAARAWIDERR
jgi:hypothetical protein